MAQVTNITSKDTFPASSALTGVVVSVNQGDHIVGTDTLFTSELQEGDYMYVPDNDEKYKIRNIISDTELSLEEPVVTAITAVVQVTNVTLTGSSGTADITVTGSGTDYKATWNTSLTQTADDFVTTHAADILADEGVVVTAAVGVIIFTSNVAGIPFSVSITNTFATLDGTVATPLTTDMPRKTPPCPYTFVSVKAVGGDITIDGVTHTTSDPVGWERNYGQRRPDPIIIDPGANSANISYML